MLAMLALGPPVAAASTRHFYLTGDADSADSLAGHAAHVDLVSPQWFQIDAAGRLLAEVDVRLVDWARARRLRLMPLVLNQGFRPEIAKLALTDATVRKDVIAGLVDAGVRFRFHGFQLDLENVPAEVRPELTAFVRVLAGELRRRGMRLSLAVPVPLVSIPGSSGADPVNERARAFDYRSLARAADFLTLMAYDQHTSPGAPGPVAGGPWVEANLERLIAEVPARRLMLGVPLYYRCWRGNKIVEGPSRAALELARSRGATVVMDATSREKTFSFEEQGERVVVWLQDAESLRERLELVRRHRLGGYSAWRLGQEDPAAWDVLSGRR